jgi:hypothetical protein
MEQSWVEGLGTNLLSVRSSCGIGDIFATLRLELTLESRSAHNPQDMILGRRALPRDIFDKS